MVKQFEIFVVNCHCRVVYKSISLLERLIEDVEKPLHTEEVHFVNLVQFCYSEVEISGSHCNRRVLKSSLLQELVRVVDFFKFFCDCLCTNLALLQHLN